MFYNESIIIAAYMNNLVIFATNENEINLLKK